MLLTILLSITIGSALGFAKSAFMNRMLVRTVLSAMKRGME